MTVDLPCGHDAVPLHWDSRTFPHVQVLETVSAPPLPDLGGAVAGALCNPIGSAPLAELARGRRSACVVVSDATRPVPNREILPPLLDTLEAAGVPRHAVTLLIATGMHRASTPEERVEMLGRSVTERYRVVDHDCRDRAELRRVALIDGVPVEINRRYCAAELHILTGMIEPHGFAGYSGGGKSLLPGLASFETMTHMHSFAMVEHPGVDVARLDGNPFRDHIDTVSRAVGVEFIVNVSLDREHRATGVFAGDVREAHRAGCRVVEGHAAVRVDEPADLVVTSGGGHPADATLYQATKGLFAARNLVKPGGTILFVAGCEEGLGSASFGNLVRSVGTPEAFRARYRDPARFVIDQWAVQAYFQVQERTGRILFHSPHLARGVVEPFGLLPVDDPSAELARLLSSHPRAYVVPEGPHLVGLVGEGGL
ncbi:MAG TPA: nickel-dependent lactate racemase [Deferrisomatales bacterium]|nr:nickel-dependent lactate racemase [Deferrisomatales bacterium]